MITWELKTFAGISPRTPEHQLRPGFATKALDVNLFHGTLKPWRELEYLQDAVPGALRIHQYGCCTYSWPKCVRVAEWLPNCPRLYVTGRVAYPEVALIQDNCTLTYQRLGVYAPNNAPALSFTPDSDPDTNTDQRAYCYTFKNNLGEESGPSYPSTGALVEDGAAVEVYGFEDPPIEYNITTICVYRRASGFHTGLEKEQEVVTDWLLVGEYPVGTDTVTDTTLLLNLGRAIPSRETREPPEKLRNITAISDTATLAGSVGNRLYFTENHQPWNWPIDQELTLDDNIMDMQDINGDLFVATDGYPYLIQGDAGCNKRECRAVHKFEYPLPMIACASGRGSVATPMGMVYVSQDGLVLLSKSTPPKIITDATFAFDDWRLLRPETMRLAYYMGAVYCVSEMVSFVLWLDASTYSEFEYQRLSTISDMPQDMVLTRNGQLLFLSEDKIWQWNSGDSLRPYEWISEPVNASFIFSVSRAHVTVIDYATTFELISDTATFSRVLGAPWDKAFAVKRLGRHMQYFVRFHGIGTVEYARLGVSYEELGSQNG